MIFGEHGVIRAAEPDDAPTLKRVYNLPKPRAAVLDRRREPYQPTNDELREALARKDLKYLGEYYAVEDKTGVIRGFCSLRAGRRDVFFGDMLLMFLDEADLERPIAAEAFAFLRNKAFAERRLTKMVAHCLDGEDALRAFLMANGFHSNGVAREILFTRGRWFNCETLSLFASEHEER
ncbi:MAG: GNAT family protein [Candidatus Hydrogenedentota bacterium]